MRRRQFIVGGMAVAGTVLTDLWRPVLAAIPGPGPYGPLQPVDANGLMLPAGFTSRIIARTGQPVGSTGYVWHGAPDGGATYARPGGGWVYVSNSELPDGAGGASAVAFAADGAIVGAYRILSGTSINCAGGSTPWGTWLSCEEDGSSGQVWECDPQAPGQGVVRPAMGSFNHEAVAFDPGTGHYFLTEDHPSGRLYRFVPTTPGDLSAGALYAASVSGTTVTWVPTSATGPDRQAATTAFNGGEGMWPAAGSVYFTTKGDRRVWQLVPGTSTLTVLHDCVTAGGALDVPDNITTHPASGDIYVAEDGGNMEVCVLGVVGASTQVAAFCRIVGHTSSEVTGPAFSPDGTRLYFSSQRGADGSTGVTYEVTGPFRASTTGPVGPTVTTLPVVDDTYVRNGTWATTAYGGSNVLSVKWETAANYQTWSYVKVDLSSLAGPVTDARLRLQARLAASPVRPTQVLGVADTGWSGATMTWSTQPAVGPVVGATTVTSSTATWHEVDVTSWVAARRAEGATAVAFLLRPDSISDNYVLISSREAAAANRPVLVVTTGSGPVEPPPNVGPTASFSHVAQGLSVSFDGRGSSDPDGTIRSWAWDLGDGTTAAGPTVARTYAAAGSYPVRLTVTDDRGAVGTTSRTVEVSAPPPDPAVVARDDFARTVTGGLGTALLGGPWTVSGSASSFRVDGATGRITLASAGSTRSAALLGVSARDVDVTLDFSVDKVRTGNGVYLASTVRRIGSSEYQFRVRLLPTGYTRILSRIVNGTETVLTSQSVSGTVVAPGTPVHVRFRAAGAGPTALAGKVWFGTAAEPTAWQIQTTDATSALQQPGGVGVYAYLSSSTTNAPLVVGVDDLVVRPAQ